MTRGFNPPKFVPPAVPAGHAPPPRRPRPRRIGLLVSVIAVILLLGAGAVFLLTRDSGQLPAGPVAQSQPASASKSMPASRGSTILLRLTSWSWPVVKEPGLDAPSPEEALKVIDAWHRCVNSKDIRELASQIDARRLFTEVQRYGVKPSCPEDQAIQLARAAADQLASIAVATSPDRSVNVRIRKIHALSRPGEAVVYYRITEGTTETRDRVWLRYTNVGWRIFDKGTLDRFRWSQLLTVIPVLWDGNPPPWRVHCESIMFIPRLTASGDLQAVKQRLDSVRGATLPIWLEAQYLLARAVYIGATDPAEAIDLAEEARNKEADLPQVHLLWAELLNRVGKQEQSVLAAQRFMDTVGVDHQACAVMGAAYEAQGFLPQAAEAYQKGLDDNPRSEENKRGLARTRK